MTALDRLTSGHRRLDQILGGGLPANSINLVIGPPGSGKTILTEQFIFHNATADRPALYLSTVSEPFDKIIRYIQQLGFFEPEAIGRRVTFEDLGSTLSRGGLPEVLARFDTLIKQHRPGLVAIDSFRALRAFAADQPDYRRFLHELAGRLTALAMTTFWVAEHDSLDSAGQAEFAVADSVISLSAQTAGPRQWRVLRVLKLRGSAFAQGGHTYRITTSGLDVYPRLADVLDPSTYALSRKRMPTGVPVLDDMLADGYWPGSATLVCGPSGVGKTLLGLHFIFKGAQVGQPGLIATLQEDRTQLERIVAGFHWSLDDPGVHLLSSSPVDLEIDQWVYQLLDAVEKTGARRVLIDSLLDLLSATGDGTRFREWLFSLVRRLGRSGVSVVMTLETAELFGLTRVSEGGMSNLADNVLLLQYVRSDSRITRALTVLKTRASRHEPYVRSFEITEKGIVLGPVLKELTPVVTVGTA